MNNSNPSTFPLNMSPKEVNKENQRRQSKWSNNHKGQQILFSPRVNAPFLYKVKLFLKAKPEKNSDNRLTLHIYSFKAENTLMQRYSKELFKL